MNAPKSTNKKWVAKFIADEARHPNVVNNPNALPLIRSKALEKGVLFDTNGWRAWVEHIDTGERIFQSHAETKFQEAGFYVDENGSTQSVNFPPAGIVCEVNDGVVIELGPMIDGGREVLGEFTWYESEDHIRQALVDIDIDDNLRSAPAKPEY